MSELKPRVFTREEVDAVASKGVMYQAGCEVLLRRGVWVIRENINEEIKP